MIKQHAVTAADQRQKAARLGAAVMMGFAVMILGTSLLLLHFGDQQILMESTYYYYPQAVAFAGEMGISPAAIGFFSFHLLLGADATRGLDLGRMGGATHIARAQGCHGLWQFCNVSHALPEPVHAHLSAHFVEGIATHFLRCRRHNKHAQRQSVHTSARIRIDHDVFRPAVW